MKRENQGRLWRTDSIYVAAALEERGFSLVGIEGECGEHREFIFENSDERKATVTSFLNGTLEGNLRHFVENWRAIRRQLDN